MFASFQKKYFLSDKGVAGVKRGIFWTTLTNLITMAGMGFLFLVMAGFVEHLASGAGLLDALPIVGGLLVFFVLLFASNWQQYYYTYCIFYEECGKQRMEIAERLRKLPLSFFGRRDLADLTETIMGDVQAMEHAYSHVLGELWGAIIASAIVFVASLLFCWQLAIAAFWSVPVAFAVLYLTRGPMTPVFDRVRAEKVKVTEAIQETLDCVREIRATNQEAHYLEGLNAVIDAEERETTKGELVNGLLVNSAFVILRLGIATTLVTGAAVVASGQVDFLVMFAFLLMVSRIYAPFDQALMLMSELFAAESSAKRMRSIMEEPVARGSEIFEPVGHDVVFDHVAFGYGAGEDGRAGEKVLTDVSFTAKEGEVTALVGPSGSGKSTVSRLAARFWDATAGKVAVGGVDVASVDPEVLLRDYAIVFQDVLLFDDTVMGNIRLGRRDATDEEVLAAARAANCDEFVNRMPQGYDTMLYSDGANLSQGQRQLLSIARAAVADPPVMILDEATSSIDTRTELLVQRGMDALMKGRTVFVIAHRLSTVQNSDAIMVLDHGRIIERGTHDDLIAQKGTYYQLYTGAFELE